MPVDQTERSEKSEGLTREIRGEGDSRLETAPRGIFRFSSSVVTSRRSQTGTDLWTKHKGDLANTNMNIAC